MEKTPPLKLTPGQKKAFDALEEGVGVVSDNSKHASALNALERKGVVVKEIEGRRCTYYRVDAAELARMGF